LREISELAVGGGQPLLLLRDGRPAAVIVGLEGWE
jgi:hypothetical protein